MANRACNQCGKRSSCDFVKFFITHRKSDMDLYWNIVSQYTYISADFYVHEKEEKITNCVNLSHVSLLCIQAGGVGARRKKHISKGNCMGRVIITTVTQQQPSFTYLQWRRSRRMMLFGAFDRDYNEACWRVYGSSSNY